MEGREFDLNSITVRTEALQVLTSEEAAYYRLLPYDVDAGGRLLCLGEEGRDYADASAKVQGYGEREGWCCKGSCREQG